MKAPRHRQLVSALAALLVLAALFAPPAVAVQYRTGQAKIGRAAAPGTAPTPALAGAGAGNVDNGAHSYKITFVHTNGGETTPSPVSGVVTVADKTVNGQVALTAIPLGPTGTASRKIYRTVAGGTGDHKLVTTVSDNTATTYTDNTADASLGASAPTANTFPTNKVTLSTGVTTGNVTVGDLFAFDKEGVFFQVSSLDGADTKVFYLSVDYSGTRTLETLADYAVVRDFTGNAGLPELGAGDIAIRETYTRAMRQIDSLIGSRRLTNRLGLTLAIGDVVALSTANDESVVADDTASRVRPYAVALEALPDVTKGGFLAAGFAPTVKSQGAITRGNYLVKSATTRAVQDSGVAATSANPPKGALGIALTAAAGPGTGTIAALWTAAVPNPLALPVAVADGGTGLASYTTGDLIYASAAAALAKLADVADGNVLRSAGVGVAPTYGKVRLSGSPTDVSGTLAIADGGTGSTTEAGARTALDVPSVAQAAAPLFAGHTAALTNTTRYLRASGSGQSTAEAEVNSEMPRASTVKLLRVRLTAAPGGIDTVIVTLRKNAANTALTCTISAAATTCQDGSNSGTFATGDVVNWSIVWSATAASSIANVSAVMEK